MSDQLASLAEAALLLDGRDRIVAANAPAEAMFGRPIAGRTTHGVLTLTRALSHADGDPVRLEGRRADDTPFIVIAQIARDGDHALVRLREPDHEELAAEAWRYFDAAFDHAPIGMALFNTDGRFVRVNEALCALLGRGADELIGRRDQEFTHPADRQADLDAAFHILEGRTNSHQTEKRFLRPDGSIVWTIANLTFLRDPDGRPLSWVGQFQDITARRAAEEALRDERDVSQAVIEAMDHGIALTHERRIVIVNEALCRLTGFSREELVGSELPFPFIPPESREVALAAREELVAHGGGEFDIGVMRKDGTRFTASITSSAVYGPDGRSRGLVNTMRDVSERRRLETELARRANVDGLTGLLNRTSFDATLAIEVAQAQAEGSPLTLALLDLDRFKQINDEHGHPVGDAVLVETAERLRRLSRDTDYIGRVGGEEFAWILPETEPPAAERAAERAVEAIRAEPFPVVGAVTISIGVCALANAADLEQLYRRADLALYAAKRAGRNRCVVWTPDI